MIELAEFQSPIGLLHVATGPAGLCAVGFEEQWPDLRARLVQRFGPDFARGDRFGALPRLEAYCAGRLDALDDLPVDPGGMDFQRAVWSALRRIPAGTTFTYERLAREVGAPGAARAVGSANAKNPVSLVLPCHRVIGKDGGLRGYAGGLSRKQWLLSHEGVRIDFVRVA